MAHRPVKTIILFLALALAQGLPQTTLAQSSAPIRSASSSLAQTPTPIRVIGYYAGRNSAIDSFPVEKLTHIIFSFCHLKGNRLNVNNANDTTIIRHLVSLKSRNPGL